MPKGPHQLLADGGTPSHWASRASVALSGVPTPFSTRDSVDALTPVVCATSRSESPTRWRWRLTSSPSSATLINESAMDRSSLSF